MNSGIKAFVVLSGFLASNCWISLNPLFERHDLVFDQRVLGAWIDSDGDTWTFFPHGDQGYRLVYMEDGRAGVFEARLGQLGNSMFLDICSQESQHLDGLSELLLLSTHVFFKVEVEQDRITLQNFTDRADNVLTAISHTRTSDYVLLTDSTPNMQAAALELESDPAVFDDPIVLSRVR